MPFVSKAQMRACWARKDPKRDCHKMYHKTKQPYKKWPERKVYIGPRGGQYVKVKGRKVYLN